jgi:hypothetical protein
VLRNFEPDPAFELKLNALSDHYRNEALSLFANSLPPGIKTLLMQSTLGTECRDALTAPLLLFDKLLNLLEGTHRFLLNNDAEVLALKKYRRYLGVAGRIRRYASLSPQ